MSNTQAIPLFSKPEHPFHGLPWPLVSLIGQSGIGGYDVFLDDMIGYAGPIAAGTLGPYEMDDATGTAAITYRTTNEEHGVIRMTVAATAGGNCQLALHNFLTLYEAGKEMWVFARVAISDADDAILYFGVGTDDNDWVNALPADGIFFEKDETSTAYDFHVRKDGTSTATAESSFSLGATTAGDDLFHTIGFHVNKAGAITPYFSVDNAVFTKGTAIASSNANVPDAAADVMIPQIFVETGAGAADYVDIDWILVVKEK